MTPEEETELGVQRHTRPQQPVTPSTLDSAAHQSHPLQPVMLFSSHMFDALNKKPSPFGGCLPTLHLAFNQAKPRESFYQWQAALARAAGFIPLHQLPQTFSRAPQPPIPSPPPRKVPRSLKITNCYNYPNRLEENSLKGMVQPKVV